MLRAALLVGGLVGPASLPAQGDFLSATAQGEWRAMLAASPRGGAGIGAGANIPAGYYVRVGVGASAVHDWDRAGGHALMAGLAARFLLDPFAESAWGAYAGGGLGAEWRSGERGRPAVTLQLGMALPGQGRWERAVEVEAGAGLRVAFVLRPRRARGR
jgi:hypothetical protein